MLTRLVFYQELSEQLEDKLNRRRLVLGRLVWRRNRDTEGQGGLTQGPVEMAGSQPPELFLKGHWWVLAS